LIHTFNLTSTFFGYSYDYFDYLDEEFIACVSYMKISYSELMNIPVYRRRNLIKKFNKLNKKGSDTDTRDLGNGKKVVSGDALKNLIKSNPEFSNSYQKL
jgi:hypothetical protein